MGVYEAVLGPVEFAKLAAPVREVFGPTARWTGRGLFEEVGAPNPLVRLALAPMVADRALPGGFGRDVPFEVSSTLVIGVFGWPRPFRRNRRRGWRVEWQHRALTWTRLGNRGLPRTGRPGHGESRRKVHVALGGLP